MAQVIQWAAPQPSQLLWQFFSSHDEIKTAKQLLVGLGQGVLLVYEGRVAEMLDAAGLYQLRTDNHTFITTLLKLRTGFESEHKLQLYFYRRAENVNQPWGTAAPVKYLDPVYHMPVKLGAHSNFSFRLADAHRFFTEVVGFSKAYSVLQAKLLLQSRIAQTLTTQLAAAGRSAGSTRSCCLGSNSFCKWVRSCALSSSRVYISVFGKALISELVLVKVHVVVLLEATRSMLSPFLLGECS